MNFEYFLSITIGMCVYHSQAMNPPPPLPPPPGQCPPEFISWDNHCYHFPSNPFSGRSQALDYCRSLNDGQLLTPKSANENNYISQQISTSQGSVAKVWLEVNSILVKYVWECMGDTCPYFNWNSPSGPSATFSTTCAIMSVTDGTWEAYGCDAPTGTSHYAVCIPAPPPPVARPPPPLVVDLVPNCPDNYYTWQSRCYHLSTAPFSSWNLANDYCKSIPDSRIFTPKSSSENDFMQTRLGIWEGQYSRVWLEATDAEAEGVWRCGRDQCSYLNWKSDEPEGGKNANCALFSAVDGNWIAYPCDANAGDAFYVVCDLNPVPPPSTNCPAGFISKHGNCYHFSSTKFPSRSESLNYCNNFQDGRLMTPVTTSENIYIVTQMIVTYGEDASAWIDANDLATEGRWMCNGFGCTFCNFEIETSESSEETFDGSDPDCAFISLDEDGYWTRTSCDESSHYAICVSGADSSSEEDVTCPNGFSAHKSYCYAVSVEDTYTWSEAKAYCRSLAALSTLACPSKKSVTDFIKSDVESFAWTGINDISVEDDWWCLGSYEQSYFRWDGGSYPNDGDVIRNCVVLKYNGKERDVDCTEQHQAVCVLDPSLTTQTPTTTQPTTKDPTTTQEPTTQQTTTAERTTVVTTEQTTTVKPTTVETTEQTTTQEPTTVVTTIEQTTTQEPTTVVTTIEQTTTQEPTTVVTTKEQTTTQEPTTVVTTIEQTTTQKPTTVVTTVEQTTTQEPTTVVTTTEQTTTQEPTTVVTTNEGTTTPAPTTSHAPTTQSTTTEATTEVHSTTREATTSATTDGSQGVGKIRKELNCTSHLIETLSSFKTFLFQNTETPDTAQEIIKEEGVLSSMQCAVNCSQNNNCSGFLFHDDDDGTATCELLGDSSDGTTVTLGDSVRMYVKLYCY